MNDGAELYHCIDAQQFNRNFLEEISDLADKIRLIKRADEKE